MNTTNLPLILPAADSGSITTYMLYVYGDIETYIAR